MISGDVPYHLVVGARTGFLATAQPEVPITTPIAQEVNMTSKSLDLVDVGAAPMPVRSRGRLTVQSIIEKKLTVTPLDWEITLELNYNDFMDDQTGGALMAKARSAGENFRKDMAQKAFAALNAGDATTSYGAGYDGLAFFHDSHVDSGAHYSTAQDNKNALTLSLDNFETVRVAARNFRDDQGEFCNYDFNTLVVSPALERTAAQITLNNQAYDTANRELNPYAGATRHIVSPQLDSTAWVLVAGSESIKPILIVIRERPSLQSAWFDPKAAKGGAYCLKFYARYNHFYGDWRTACMGNT